MINETMTQEEFDRHCLELDMSEVEIAVAAAFHGDFEPVDCRDMAEMWISLQSVVNIDVRLWHGNAYRQTLMEVGDWLMHIGLIETYDYVPEYTNERCVQQAQDWAKAILTKLYDMGDDDE
jgi:hypothetical protein